MPILKNIKLNKIDSKTKELIKEKFVFGIYEDEECNNLIKEVKSNKNDGYVIFEELRYGKYYIKELKAPAGYELSNKVVSIEINDNGVLADGNLIEENDSIYNINFENDIIEVPNTGDDRNTEIFALIGGKGVVFATGTPVSNSMVELYTMQRYLQYNTLEKSGLLQFDSWASTFGNTVSALELKVIKMYFQKDNTEYQKVA